MHEALFAKSALGYSWTMVRGYPRLLIFMPVFALFLLAGCSDRKPALDPPVNDTTDAAEFDMPKISADPNVDSGVCTISVTHDCEQVIPPTVEWPSLTEIRDTDCNLKIRVKEDGYVTVVDATCTDDRLVPTVTEAASTIRYKTHDVCGEVCPEIGGEFDYPIYFRLE